MKTYGFDRIKLSRNLSIDELLQLEEEVKKASLNEFKDGIYFENGKPSIHIYNKNGLKKLDNIGWAIFNKTKRVLV
ncbi:hypothetical protein [Acinetobacter sp. P8-3-8]|uniref:hypothetical protein n=1 Tax=Acinetobacter sp. P8-3-8 TaxID=1029823 RepID=UPI00024865A0|nr:hypothetical protein [Acinetobacter sp. P8-3-8]